MKMNFKLLICFIAACLLITSCKKDTAITAPITAKNNSTSSTSYISLTVGNYWVYNVYQLDSAGTETFMNKTDSLYIQKDSIIGTKTYYYFKQSNDSTIGASVIPLANNWVIDSSGFILSLYHYKFLDPIHLNDTIQKDTMTWGVVLYIVPLSFTNASVPAGLFSGISMNTRMRYLNPSPFN